MVKIFWDNSKVSVSLKLSVSFKYKDYYCSWCCDVSGPKKSFRTSSIVQIISLFRSFEINKDFRVFKALTFRNILLSNF